jgi:hypothetical protein
MEADMIDELRMKLFIQAANPEVKGFGTDVTTMLAYGFGGDGQQVLLVLQRYVELCKERGIDPDLEHIIDEAVREMCRM